jgi:hypothetical protein
MDTFLFANGPAIMDDNGRTFASSLSEPSIVPSQYRLLVDHFISNSCGGQVFQAGSVVNEGVEIPTFWTPTQAVDPLNQSAIQKFWENGPIGIGGAEFIDIKPSGYQSKPSIYWVKNTNGTFILTGAGAALGPKDPL